MDYLILEAKSGKTKYKCEFCSFRGTKEDLVDHVEKEHSDMIPENYTAARTVFNHLNKKDHGNCIVCGGETDWDEDNWRYQRLHPQCKAEYTKHMKENMKRVYGKENLLNDPEQQKKMLKNRKISGTYQFKTDGGKIDYVGSYERKTLEFLDKAMNIKSSDLSCPGPTIEYYYNNEKHLWITDIYYIPLNLVIEVKDGGDNPNNREMRDYRLKQIAKEEAIVKEDKYNYLRLTNNNFEQLLYILAELKTELMDPDSKDKKHVYHINENSVKNSKLETAGNSAVGMAMHTGAGNANAVLIPYRNPDNNLYSMALKRDDEDEIYIFDDDSETVIKESMEYVQNKFYSMYRYKKPMTMEMWGKCTDPKYSEKAIPRSKDFFYKELTGRKLLNIDQLDCDSDFEKVEIGRLFY